MAISGLNYISLSIGYALGTQIVAPLNDRVYRWLKARNDGIGKPEVSDYHYCPKTLDAHIEQYRCPAMIPGSLLVVAGLFWVTFSIPAFLTYFNITVVWLVRASQTTLDNAQYRHGHLFGRH